MRQLEEFASKICFLDEKQRTVVVLARMLESDDPQFIKFKSGSGRTYIVNRVLLLSVQPTTQLFKLKNSPARKPLPKPSGETEEVPDDF